MTEPYYGWLPELSQREMDVMVARSVNPLIEYDQYIAHFADDRETPEEKRMWEYAKEANGGEHIPTWRQETGDCVGMGDGNGVTYISAYEIAGLYQEETPKIAHPSFPYAVGRVAPDLGNGRLGREAGSTGAWGIGAVCQYGTLFVDDPGVPPYSGGLSDTWGIKPGPPREFWDLAADNRMGKKARLTTVEQVRRELINRRPVTMAMMWDFEMRAVMVDGYHVFRRGARAGGHQTCLIEWMKDPFPAAYCINSWGATIHGRPLNGEPPGGAWVRAEDLDYHLNAQYSEFFSMALFEGEPGPVDPSPL